MKKLHFESSFTIGYSNEIPKCFYTIKSIPMNTDIQKVLSWEVEFQPDTEYSISEDGFKNRKLIGCVDTPHDSFTFRIQGEVLTGLSEAETEKDEMSVAKYRYPTALLRPGAALRSFAGSLGDASDLSVREAARYYMEELGRHFKYESDVTDPSTSAESAFSFGKGVCQDYSHIFISLCQMKKMPARYVAGMMIGEGETHAWVEVFDGRKWIGVDPTNQRYVDADYIKLGIGRDASDCAINRGLIMGNGGRQTLTSRVVVREAARHAFSEPGA